MVLRLLYRALCRLWIYRVGECNTIVLLRRPNWRIGGETQLRCTPTSAVTVIIARKCSYLIPIVSVQTVYHPADAADTPRLRSGTPNPPRLRGVGG
jgi:hypothetical protein